MISIPLYSPAIYTHGCRKSLSFAAPETVHRSFRAIGRAIFALGILLHRNILTPQAVIRGGMLIWLSIKRKERS
jgi:hypothetical protein